MSRGASGVLTGVQAAQVIGVAKYSLTCWLDWTPDAAYASAHTRGRDGARDNGD